MLNSHEHIIIIFFYSASINVMYLQNLPPSLLYELINFIKSSMMTITIRCHHTLTLWRQKCSTVFCFCGKIMKIKHKIKFIILIHYSPFNNKFKVHKITIWKQPINRSMLLLCVFINNKWWPQQPFVNIFNLYKYWCLQN